MDTIVLRGLNPTLGSLWDRLVAYSFDDPRASSPFSARLAREQGWTRRYALRTIEEYRRFLFLAAAADHPVCPSDAVDEVWHLHLTFTRSYWDGLCGEVLGRPLHHEPSRGGAAQSRLHERMYRSTLHSYQRFFGAPPADVWPPPAERFDAMRRGRHVDLSEHWVVPRPSWRKLRPQPLSLFGRVLAARRARRWRNHAAAATIPALALLALPNPLDWRGPQFLALYASLLVVAILFGFVLRRSLRVRADRSALPPDLDTLDTAYLAGGGNRVVQAALVGLLERGVVSVDETDRRGPTFRLTNTAPAARKLSGVEREIVDALQSGSPLRASELPSRVRDECERIGARLEGNGLLETSATSAAVRFWPPALLLALAAFAGAKVVIGIQRDRAVELLVMMVIATLIAAAVFARKPRLTLRGQSLLRELRRRAKRYAPSSLDSLAGSAAAAPSLAPHVAVLGVAALTGTSLTDARRWLRETGGTSDAGGGTSGCGGGGNGGGGDSGCGGCGGGN